MIVRCENCGTSFNFDENLVKGEGAWLRCGKCRFVFFVADPDAPKGAGESIATLTAEIAPDDTFEKSALPEQKPETAAKKDIAGIFLWVAVAVLAIGLVVSIPLVFNKQFIAAKNTIVKMFAGKAAQQEQIAPSAPLVFQPPPPSLLPAEALEKLGVMASKRSYFKDAQNKVALVQEGKVLNRTGQALQNIKIEGKLFSGKGKVLQSAIFICGNDIGDEKIKEGGRALVLSALTNANPSIVVEPNKEVLFKMVFFDVGDDTGNAKGTTIAFFVKEAQVAPVVNSDNRTEKSR